jgi:hypothetical protein
MEPRSATHKTGNEDEESHCPKYVLYHNRSVNSYGNAEMSELEQDHGLRVGDRISHIPDQDCRSWWQRHAPRWAGGKEKPLNFDGWIITEITSVGCGIEEPPE